MAKKSKQQRVRQCFGRKEVAVVLELRRHFQKTCKVSTFAILECVFSSSCLKVAEHTYVLEQSCPKVRLSTRFAVEKLYSWDFGTFQSGPLSHGFAVGRSMFAWFWHGESHDPRNSCHLGRLFRGLCVEQVYFPDSVHRFGGINK